MADSLHVANIAATVLRAFIYE